MKSFIVTESCDIILEGEKYRLQEGDRIMVEDMPCPGCGGPAYYGLTDIECPTL